MVAPIAARYRIPRPSNTARASWEITVSCSEGTAPIGPARKLMPRNSEPRMPDIHIRVTPAFRLRGSLKAGMPFEMASTPVTAVVPLENACSSRNSPNARVVSIVERRRVGHRVQRSGQVTDEARAHGQVHHRDEEVGRQREDEPGLLDPAQVDEHDEADQQHAERHAPGEEAGEGGRDLRDAGGDRDRHRQDVVHQQRRPGDLGREVADVVARDDVRAAARGVGVDRLLVGDREDHEQPHDRGRHRQHPRERGRARHGEDDQDLLRRVRGRRQRVRGEDGEAHGLADRLVRGVRRRQRAADQPAAPAGRRVAADSRCTWAAVGAGADEGGLAHGSIFKR